MDRHHWVWTIKCFSVTHLNWLFMPDVVPQTETERQVIILKLFARKMRQKGPVRVRWPVRRSRDATDRIGMHCQCRLNLLRLCRPASAQGLQSYWNHKCVQEEAHQNHHRRILANGVPCLTRISLHSRKTNCNPSLVTMTNFHVCTESAPNKAGYLWQWAQTSCYGGLVTGSLTPRLRPFWAAMTKIKLD